jgi:predicted lipoprotein
MQKQDWLKLVLCAALAGLFASCVIVKNDEKNSGLTASEEKAFGLGHVVLDSKQYADEIWEPIVLPRIESMGVDFKELLSELENDEDGASRKYGYRLLEEGNHYNFAVKGNVKFLSIDTSSMNGSVSLDFTPFDGQPDCLMSIGPVFRGSTIRDIQNTISINDFGNQVDFARLARELNNKVKDLVLNNIDFTKHIDEEVGLLGVFTYEGRDKTIEIMPLRLSFNARNN